MSSLTAKIFIIALFCLTAFSQEIHHFAFTVAAYPVYSENNVVASDIEFSVVSLVNSNEKLKLNTYFDGVFDITYPDELLDSFIVVKIVQQTGKLCRKEMKIYLKPSGLIPSIGKIENIFIRDIPVINTVYEVKYPAANDTIKFISFENLFIFRNKDYPSIPIADITKYQKWKDYSFINPLETNKPVYFYFRLYNGRTRLDKNYKKKFSISYTIPIEMDERFKLEDFELQFDNIVNMFKFSFFPDYLSDKDDFDFFIKNKYSGKVTILNYSPLNILFSTCKFHNIFVDSINLNGDNYYIDFPKNQNEWNNINLVKFQGADEEFFDCTSKVKMQNKE